VLCVASDILAIDSGKNVLTKKNRQSNKLPLTLLLWQMSPPPMASLNIQDAIDFSDVYVTEQSKDEVLREDQDKQQIQTINDRFRAAKRNIVEFKMKNGVYTNKQRRQLVESLLRRAPCGRRIRSWRTENSDFLRGDVRPKANSQSGNLIRSAKNNPDIDLHPGALGPMAGLQGQWLSEENLPGNIFADMDAAGE
jgi:hypothetical protein